MRRTILGILLVGSLALAGALPALGAGFNIYEAGSRATAMGGAFTATADDGSSLFYNPAGLSFLSGSSFEVNLFGIGPRMSFASAYDMTGDEYTEKTKNKTYLAPGTYFTHKFDGKYAAGLGIYAPFGLGVKWQNPEEWVGRQVSYDTELQTVYVTPAVSYELAEGLALAVGVDIAVQHLTLNKYTLHPTLGVNALDTEITGTSDPNITPTFGLMYRPNEKLSFGAMHHMEKTLDYKDKDATLANAIEPGMPGYDWSSQLLAGLGGSDQTVSAEFNLPSITSVGVAYRFSDRVLGEFDYVYFTWDAFKSLELDFENDNLDQAIHFDYENAWQIRFGLDYVAIPDKLNLMCGYVHDTTPQPLKSVSPLLPDSDRDDYSVGAMIKSGNIDINFSYMAVIGTERTNIENGQPANPDPAYPVGSYKSIANIFGVGLGYHF